MSKFPKLQIKAREDSGIGKCAHLEVRPHQNDCEIIPEENPRRHSLLPVGSSKLAALTIAEMLKLSSIIRTPKRSRRDAGKIAPAEEQPYSCKRSLLAYAKRWMLAAVDASWFEERFSPPESRFGFLSYLAYRRDWSEIWSCGWARRPPHGKAYGEKYMRRDFERK